MLWLGSLQWRVVEGIEGWYFRCKNPPPKMTAHRVAVNRQVAYYAYRAQGYPEHNAHLLAEIDKRRVEINDK